MYLDQILGKSKKYYQFVKAYARIEQLYAYFDVYLLPNGVRADRFSLT